ncbi:hypothetical protein [Pectobacterium phage Wc4-1]|uniref:Uncharacterized protein n=3 Tax=Arnovirus TaxID=3425109 RepID=A0A5P8D566_9CAUD|nr:hypothetical protein Arno162_14 [Pectobacterium phage Arno162]AZV02196.1 hypothetical protein Arno18_11 [Pectobacterium phage Arno18]QFP93791.1 hypothetical protein [Pectobacterium phage Wc4]QFP93936.1 hypothetical protein [Pectobacterium phage Wc4-1]
MSDEDAKHLVVLFLEEHWAAWESHCEQRGEDAEGVFVQLGGEPE